MKLLRRYLPILAWGAEYSGKHVTNDLIVAAIVTVMLIPQSLAYALLAGLPPQVGLYASMAPLVLYAVFGTSRALAVGPVAVASLMTAAAVGTGRGPGNAGVPGGGHRARRWSRGCCCSPWGCCGWGSSRTSSATRSSRASSPPRASRSRPASSAPVLGIQRGGREPSSRSSKSLVPNLGQINPCHRGDRPRVAGASSSGSRARPQAPAAPRRASASGPRTSWRRWAPPWPSSRPPLAVWGFGLDRARRQDRRHGPQGPAPARPAAVRRGALDEAPRPRAADLDRRLRGVDLGRPDARRQAPPARRPRPGTDRARRCRTSARPSRAASRSPAASRARW